MAYFDKYGVKFSDDCKNLVRCPEDLNGEYIIPDSVTSIEDFAFAYCKSLTSITIPNSVTSIGKYALTDCIGLTSVTIPNSVTSIEECAFYGCTNLTSVAIPNSVTSIGGSAFGGCTGLKSIKVAEGNSSYRSLDGVLFDKYSRTIIRYPIGKEGEYAIPASVTTIGNNAFSGCTRLTNITIPNSVTIIGFSAFHSCTNLTSVTIPNSVTNIGGWAFLDVPNVIYTGELDTSGWQAKAVNGHVDGFLVYSDASKTNLLGCSTAAQGEIKIPNSVTSIGKGAFGNCSSLTSVTIPDSVTSIGVRAFYGCTGLTSITIPDSVTSIGKYAFRGCTGLTSIVVANGNTIYDSRNNCNSIIETATNMLATGCKNTIVPNSVTSIGEFAFANCTSLASITIPDSVTSIGKYAFTGCIGLTSVTIPNSVTSIEECAFYGCTGLTSVTIPDSVTSIGHGAFTKCTELQTIIIPRGKKEQFLKMKGITGVEDKLVERDNEEIIVLNNLAKAYEKGIGVNQSVTQAFLIYTQAAEKGSAEAAYRLAEWYQEGKIIPQDLNKALDYFQLSAQSNYADASSKVKEVQDLIEKNAQRMSDIVTEENNARIKASLERDEAERRNNQEENQKRNYYLFFDTETTGVPYNYKAPVTDSYNWPRLVQLAWIMTDKEGNILKKKSVIIKPKGFSIPTDAVAVHGITTERAQRDGLPLRDVLEEFTTDLSFAAQVVGHNIDFDRHIVGAELYRLNMDYNDIIIKPGICTMKSSTDFCAIPSPDSYYGGYKWPSLQELFHKLFNRDFVDAHDALADITATKDCFFELKRIGII